jgi:hypothetical protein
MKSQAEIKSGENDLNLSPLKENSCPTSGILLTKAPLYKGPSLVLKAYNGSGFCCAISVKRLIFSIEPPSFQLAGKF